MERVYFPSVRRNKHLQACIEHFGALTGETSRLSPDTAFVFVCYTNRCGSNYLSSLFASSGQYNLAAENLNYEAIHWLSARFGITHFQSYFSFLTQRLGKSGTLLLKLAIPHIELLGRAGILDEIVDRSKFVFIERRDKLAQAISHVIAFGTGRYTSLTAGSRTPEQLEFSREKIDVVLNEIAEANRQFDLFFGRNGFIPVTTIYEDLVSDPINQAQLIARQVGLRGFHVDLRGVQLEQQTGSINAEWRERYLRRIP